MAVVFKVECRETKPGDGVFVLGSHSSLGDFNPPQALRLSTTAAAFPVWTSVPVILPIGTAVSFKFVVQLEDRSGGDVKWETLQETNRNVTGVTGVVSTVRTKWGVYHSELITTVDEALVHAAEQRQEEAAKERQEEENLKIQKAESEAEEAVAQVPEDSVASAIMSRSRHRRNFSQSLISVGWEKIGSNCSLMDLAKEKKTESAVLKGVNLKHISSFSALCLMAGASEKDEARSHSTKPQYDPHNLEVPVVIVTSEVAPWSKTGGLGLVAASYSYEFPHSGHRTMLIAPKYKHYDGITLIGETKVLVNGKHEAVKYWHLIADSGCDMVFVDHPSLERGGGLYSDNHGIEWPDNLFRFTLLSMAALEAPLILKISGAFYGDKVFFIANDWQAGLVPFYMCHKYRKSGVYTESRVAYAVHNLGYQGQYHGVNACNFFGVDNSAARDLAQGSCVNLCKAALICADRVLTVSPNYAQEIQTPSGGFGLQDFVRAKVHSQRLVGILNGIDDKWNPETDKIIAQRYSVDTFVEGKRVNKAALQKTLRLDQNPDCVLIGFTGRLTGQKGVDILGAIVPWLMKDTGNGVTGNFQLLMMGNGEKQYADVLRDCQAKFPGRVCGYVGFDPEVEHKVMAGCDIFLMPSRYEPCGLPQMCSQQYGTLPIVTATGGLKDSVKDISAGPDVATGFHVPVLNEAKLKEIVYKAADLFFHDHETFQAMQRTAMRTDFYWTRAIDEYEKQIDVTLYDAPIER